MLRSSISNTLDTYFCIEQYSELVPFAGPPGITNTDQGSMSPSGVKLHDEWKQGVDRPHFHRAILALT